MFIYIVIFVIVLLWLSLGEKEALSRKKLMFCLLGLALFVGFGDMLGGYDRYIYAELFDDTSDATDAAIPYIDTSISGYYKEYGYVLLNILISHITANRYIFILLVTFIIYGLIYKSFSEYLENYPLGMILFLGLMFCFTFTYLREVIAVSISWYAMRYAVKRNFWKFILFASLAISFHNSAVIFLPFYFFPIRKFNPKTIAIVMTILLLIGISPLPAQLYTHFGALTGSEERTTYYAEELDRSGIRIEYIIEAVFFLFFILKNYDKVTKDKQSLIFTNAAIVFCAVLMLFIKSSSGGRLGWYYMIGVIVTLVKIGNFKDKISYYRKFLVLISFILYLRFILYWGIYLYPYKTFLTNGHRDDDNIFYRFEYDQKYDKNKFYRPIFKF